MPHAYLLPSLQHQGQTWLQCDHHRKRLCTALSKRSGCYRDQSRQCLDCWLGLTTIYARHVRIEHVNIHWYSQVNARPRKDGGGMLHAPSVVAAVARDKPRIPTLSVYTCVPIKKEDNGTTTTSWIYKGPCVRIYKGPCVQWQRRGYIRQYNTLDGWSRIQGSLQWGGWSQRLTHCTCLRIHAEGVMHVQCTWVWYTVKEKRNGEYHRYCR